LVTADRFGAVDFLANLETMRGDLPALEFTAVVGNAGAEHVAFDDLLGEPLDTPATVDPDAPALIAYTSGTTSDPKGVVHSHRRTGAEIRQLGAMQAAGPPILMGAPVGHGIGMLGALLLPVWRKQSIFLIDQWDPQRVLAGMLEDRISSGQ